MIKPLIEGDLEEIERYIENDGNYIAACSSGLFTIKLDHIEQTEKLAPDVYVVWDCPQFVCFHDEHHAAIQETEFEAFERK